MNVLHRLLPALTILFSLCLPGITNAESSSGNGDDLARDVAKSYGIDQWNKVEQIKYTFNIKSENREMARHWTWRPEDDMVTLEIEGEPTIVYKRSELDENTSEEVITADKQFINDSYWLLFPFQLVWSDPSFTDTGVKPLPIGEGEGRKLIVQFPDGGGYTPGDAYDLYLDSENNITHWVFRRGGGEKGSAMTWENNIELGPITVCTDHHNPDNTFRLWFSGLEVTTKNGKTHSAP